jgi:multiple sugar transport system permease protein
MKNLKRFCTYGGLILAAAVVMFPFVWMISTAFKLPEHAFDLNLIPRPGTLENFSKVIFNFGFGRYFVNSLIVAGSAALVTTFFASLAAYAFAKKQFPLKNTLFAVFLASMMVPGLMYVVPQFAIVSQLGWMNTYKAMVIPHLANVFGLFLMRQYLAGIPDDLIDAAHIDGASEARIFFHLILPLSSPVVATLFLLTFQFHWNNFLWQLIVTNDSSLYTVPVGLALFKSAHEELYTLKMAGSCFSIIPIAVIFLFTQRFFIEGMTKGALKD